LLTPFGRELLLSDVLAGIKKSTWIERTLEHDNDIVIVIRFGFGSGSVGRDRWGDF